MTPETTPPAAIDQAVVIRPLPHQTVSTCLVTPIRATDPQVLAETLQLQGWPVKRWGIGLIVQARALSIKDLLARKGYDVRVGEGLIRGGQDAAA